MSAQPHAYFNPTQAQAFIELASKKDSKFDLKYFAFHGLAAPARLILAAADAKFTNTVPEDFANTEKPLTPFGLMPVLKETSADGKTTIHIAESDAIERYLAKKFGFAGDNIFEETVINQYVSNATGIVLSIFSKYFGLKDEAQKKEALETIITGPLTNWAARNEEHLVANGSNGHFVGNKVTLADIKIAYIIRIFQGVSDERVISQAKTPAILKVKNAVEALPGVQKWIASADYIKFTEETVKVIKF